MKAVLYARVASRSQDENENKIENQLDQLEAYCKQRSIQVVKVYYDVGCGMDFNRKGYREMITDIEKGVVNVHLLICTGNSRLSRDLTSTFLVAKTMLKHKVKIRFINTLNFKKEQNGNN